MYAEEDMLMLSGIQHFVFCPRQWALIHIDGYWKENILTTQGKLLHTRVDNPGVRNRLNGIDTIRHVAIASHELGLYGVTDAVELVECAGNIVGGNVDIFSGKIPFPVEYKRGHSKSTLCDVMQLTAQAMCLEEMYGIKVPRGALFYWQTRRREEVEITESLKNEARKISATMHELYKNGDLPERTLGKGCKNCSLYEECQPELVEICSAKKYLKDNLYAEDA